MNLRLPSSGWNRFLPVVFFSFLLTSFAQETIPLASFAHFDRQARDGKPLAVVFFGGSLTGGEGASDLNRTSFRALMQSHLENKYSDAQFSFYNAAMGATGSKLGMFRLERDVLAHKPDLVFLDFTIEDGLDGADREALASYERILRKLIGEGVPVVQILAGTQDYFGSDWKHLGPPRFRDHLEMGNLYHTAIGNSFPLIQRYLANEKRDRTMIWLEDEKYPNDVGHRFIFEAARSGLAQAILEKRLCNVPTDAVFAESYRDIFQFSPATFLLPAGWTRGKTLRPTLVPIEVSTAWMNEIAVFDAKDGGTAEPIQLKFHGTFVGILGEADGEGLGFRVLVDGEVMPYEFEDEVWPTSTARFGGTERFFWHQISDKLRPGRHTIEILPAIPEGVERGQLRIESICVAGPGPDAPQSIAAGSAGF